MTDKVKPIPDGYHTATPYLVLQDAARAIEFYKQAFGATELLRNAGPGGKIQHAEIRIGDSRIMLGDEPRPSPVTRTAESSTGPRVLVHLYVEDADAVFNRAVEAGAKVISPMADQAYGDRSGGFIDPFGMTWYVATHIKEVR
jgi:PhnB protein